MGCSARAGALQDPVNDEHLDIGCKAAKKRADGEKKNAEHVKSFSSERSSSTTR